MVSEIPKQSKKGFSNQVALLIIAAGYPLGITGLAYMYSEKYIDTGNWATKSIPREFPQEQMSEQSARNAIQEWWGVRSRIFAQPYDASAASSLVAAGPLWDDLNKLDGPVAWLKNNNQYYTYQSTTIQKVVSFDSQKAEKPSIIVTVNSQDTLNGPGIYKPSSSTNNFEYIFTNEGGRWKIWNYKQI